MTDLGALTDKELRGELARREKADTDAHWDAVNERYGPCPECGAKLKVYKWNIVREHWSAPGWDAWPVPPPELWHGRKLVAQEIEVTLTCENGHVRYERDVKVAKDAAAVRAP